MMRLEGDDCGPQTNAPSWHTLELAGPHAEVHEDDDTSDDQELRALPNS